MGLHTTPVTDLPETREGFLRADLAKPGDTITLPESGSAKITHVESGIDFNMRRVILIYSTKDPIVPRDFSPRSYIPVTQAG